MSFTPIDLERIRARARSAAREIAERFPGTEDERKELVEMWTERLTASSIRLRERDELVAAHPASTRYPELARLLTDGTRLPAEVVIARLLARDEKERGAA